VTARNLRRLAWALAATATTVAAATLLLLAGAPGAPPPDGFQTTGIADTLQSFMVVLAGAVLAARRPRNPIGWLLLGLGLCFLILPLVEAYVAAALAGAPNELPAARWVAWVGNWIWVPALACIALLFLLFPNGRLLSSRWRPVAWAAVAATGLLLVATAGHPGPLEVVSSVREPDILRRFDNPLGITALAAFTEPLIVLIQGAEVLGIASLALRFRRSRGEERQQLKWVAYAAVLFALQLVMMAVGRWVGLVAERPARWLEVLGDLTSLGLLVAIAVAVLTHGLYDIDRVINRTLVYGFLTAVLGLGYTTLVVVLGQLVGRERSNLVIAGATLATAALFQPARRRIQAAVDRRFNRRRYDAAKMIEAFSARLREEIDLDTLTAELLGVVEQTMQPTGASLWLRPSGGGSAERRGVGAARR
jgi:hypothetical protein